MSIIKQDDLIVIKNKLSLEYEIGGFILYGENEYMCISEQENACKTITSRPSYTYKEYSEIIYHTHPLFEKSYPSCEDILKIMKKKNDTIKKQLIFTKWGIWNIECDNKIIEDEIQITKAQTVLDFYLANIYFKNNKGRELLDMDSIKENINKIMEKLNIFKIKIRFDVWPEKDYIL